MASNRTIIFYVHLDVYFKKPLRLQAKDGPPFLSSGIFRGFIQEIGCTASSEEMMETSVIDFSTSNLDRDNTKVRFEYIGVIDADNIEKEIYSDNDIVPSLKQDPRVCGVWYASGRGYYT